MGVVKAAQNRIWLLISFGEEPTKWVITTLNSESSPFPFHTSTHTQQLLRSRQFLLPRPSTSAHPGKEGAIVGGREEKSMRSCSQRPHTNTELTYGTHTHTDSTQCCTWTRSLSAAAAAAAHHESTRCSSHIGTSKHCRLRTFFFSKLFNWSFLAVWTGPSAGHTDCGTVTVAEVMWEAQRYVSSPSRILKNLMDFCPSAGSSLTSSAGPSLL